MAKFIFNYDGTKLINCDHIVKLEKVAPKFEQKKWRVVADVCGYGTEILFVAEENEYECNIFLHDFLAGKIDI